jgi:parallel beta-helix repeat protein
MKMKWIIIIVILLLPCWVGAATETFYVCEGGDGTLPETATCGTAYDAADFNTSANWDTDDSDDGKIGPNDNVEIMDDGGVIRATLTPQQPGLSSKPITIIAQSGDTPIINGSDLVTTWTDYSPSAGGLSDESFEGAGYEESWSETEGAGSTVDEDSTDVTPPPGGGNQTLKIQKVSPNFNASTNRELASEEAVTYSRFYVQIAAEGLADTEKVLLNRGRDASWDSAWQVWLLQDGADLKFHLWVYNNGSDAQYTASDSISLDTWYRIDVKYDVTGTAWAWRIDETVEDSGSLTGSTRSGVKIMDAGDSVVSETATFYIDLAAMDTSGYVDQDISNVWQATVTTEPNQIFLDTTKGISETGTCPEDLGTDTEWCWTSNVLYQHSSSDPDSRYTSPGTEASSKNYGISIDGKSYITIDGLTIKYANLSGIWVGGVSSNFTLQNSTLTYNHYNGLWGSDAGEDRSAALISDNTFSYNGGVGILWNHDYTSGTIQNNTVNNNGEDSSQDTRAGIKTFGSNGSGLIIQNNLVHSNSAGNGIIIDTMGTGMVVRYNVLYGNLNHGIFVEKTSSSSVYYNIVYDNSAADWGADYLIEALDESLDANSNLIYNNVSYNSNGSGIRINVGDDAGDTQANNNLIKNNIVIDATTANLFTSAVAANDSTNSTGNVIDSNCFDAESANFITWGGTQYSTYDNFETAYGGTTNSVEVDPDFTNPGSDDFTLQYSSPAYDAGTNLGATYDDCLHPSSSWPSSVTTVDQDLYPRWEIGAYCILKQKGPGVGLMQ